jgi:hypothetical protein
MVIRVRPPGNSLVSLVLESSDDHDRARLVARIPGKTLKRHSRTLGHPSGACPGRSIRLMEPVRIERLPQRGRPHRKLAAFGRKVSSLRPVCVDDVYLKAGQVAGKCQLSSVR